MHDEDMLVLVLAPSFMVYQIRYFVTAIFYVCHYLLEWCVYPRFYPPGAPTPYRKLIYHQGGANTIPLLIVERLTEIERCLRDNRIDVDAL